MGEKQEKERVNWLSDTLASQRTTISSFLDRLRGIAVRVGDSLSLNKKFMRLMDQVATDREKELGIINEIEAIEKRHSEMKQMRLLKRADQTEEAKRKRRLKELEDEKQQDGDEDDEDTPNRLSTLETILVFWLFSTKSGFLSSIGSLFSKKLLSGEPAPQPKADKLEPTVE